MTALGRRLNLLRGARCGSPGPRGRRGLLPSCVGVPPGALLPTGLSPTLLRAQRRFPGHCLGQPSHGQDLPAPARGRFWALCSPFSKILLGLRPPVHRVPGAAGLTLPQHLLGLGFWEFDEHVPEADHGLAWGVAGGGGWGEKRERKKGKGEGFVRGAFLPGHAAVPRAAGLPRGAPGWARTSPSGSGSFCSARRASRFRFRFTSRSTICKRERGSRGSGLPAAGEGGDRGEGWPAGANGGGGGNRAVPAAAPPARPRPAPPPRPGSAARRPGPSPWRCRCQCRCRSRSRSAAVPRRSAAAAARPGSAAGGARWQRAPWRPPWALLTDPGTGSVSPGCGRPRPRGTRRPAEGRSGRAALSPGGGGVPASSPAPRSPEGLWAGTPPPRRGSPRRVNY